MGYSKIALEDKIQSMYPEIRDHAIAVNLDFNEDNNFYTIKFMKDRHELKTFLDKSDADECMEGMRCVHLGVKIGEFIDNFEAGE